VQNITEMLLQKYGLVKGESSMIKNLAIITLNYNGSEDTIECIKSLDDSITEYKYDIYILDNASAKEEVEKIRDYIGTRKDFSILPCDEFRGGQCSGNYLVVSSENYGFAGGNNKIVDCVQEYYDYVLLLNNDTVVTNDFIDTMLNYLYSNREVKFASCRIDNYYDRNLLWNCGGELKPWGVRRYFSADELGKMPEIITTEFITGCALYIDTILLRKHGGLTEDFFFGEEDFNFCWRMKRLGVKGKCVNRTLVYHKVSVSSKNAGVLPGKLAGYFVNRIVDMKQFYPYLVWLCWREILIFVLGIKWTRMNIDRVDVKKMKYVLREKSHNSSVTKEDTFSVWNLFA